MTDDPQGFHPPQPKPERKPKKKPKWIVFGIDWGVQQTVIAGERIKEGSLVYIGDDGKVYNALPPDA